MPFSVNRLTFQRALKRYYYSVLNLAESSLILYTKFLDDVTEKARGIIRFIGMLYAPLKMGGFSKLSALAS